MPPAPSPKVSREHSFSLVWVVPALAVAIGAWMGIRELANLGPEISIDFADSAGVEAGRTTLEYKGMAVGTVEAVDLRRDLKGVTLRLRLRKNAASVANADSKFWIVHPEIGLSGVHGL